MSLSFKPVSRSSRANTAPRATKYDLPNQRAAQSQPGGLFPKLLACAASIALFSSCPDAIAARFKLPPPTDDPERCLVEALDKFADTRANFSQEASGGMDEALVDVRFCNFSNLDLRTKVFSGILHGPTLNHAR